MNKNKIQLLCEIASQLSGTEVKRIGFDDECRALEVINNCLHSGITPAATGVQNTYNREEIDEIVSNLQSLSANQLSQLDALRANHDRYNNNYATELANLADEIKSLQIVVESLKLSSTANQKFALAESVETIEETLGKLTDSLSQQAAELAACQAELSHLAQGHKMVCGFGAAQKFTTAMEYSDISWNVDGHMLNINMSGKIFSGAEELADAMEVAHFTLPVDVVKCIDTIDAATMVVDYANIEPRVVNNLSQIQNSIFVSLHKTTDGLSLRKDVGSPFISAYDAVFKLNFTIRLK